MSEVMVWSNGCCMPNNRWDCGADSNDKTCTDTTAAPVLPCSCNFFDFWSGCKAIGFIFRTTRMGTGKIVHTLHVANFWYVQIKDLYICISVRYVACILHESMSIFNTLTVVAHNTFLHVRQLAMLDIYLETSKTKQSFMLLFRMLDSCTGAIVHIYTLSGCGSFEAHPQPPQHSSPATIQLQSKISLFLVHDAA